MTFTFLGPDPVDAQVELVLRRLAAGQAPDVIEVAQVDVKEEPGRRGHGGVVLPGTSENEAAAEYLAGEMACLANTPGGGGIIVGVADDGTHIGTLLSPEWVRHRIWELTGQRLTVTVRVVDLDGIRLLVVITHEAIEPIRYRGRLLWRVDDNCVEVDATTWHAGRLQRIGVDWSAQPSGHTSSDVRAAAVEVARRYLRSAGDAGDEGARDLALAPTPDLLRRLHLIGDDDRLSNAGSLLFVGTPEVGIDYIRRDAPGGDSTSRVRDRGPLLEQVFDVDKASEAANRRVHIPDGFAHGQVRALPPRALREAMINGAVHRDWLSPQPTTVEHVGDAVTVTSPGGFIGGVDPTNIITHPAVPRYRSLAEAMAALRLAEREGIGVDRMVRDMLALGHKEPEIGAINGPYVRVTLIGGDPDPELVGFIASVAPAMASDIDALLLIDHLVRYGWLDVDHAAPVLQRLPAETHAAIDRLAGMRIEADPVITAVKGTPAGSPAAHRLGDVAKATLARRLQHAKGPAGRTDLILGWARGRGRVSTTEVADLTAVSVPYAGTILTGLEEDGLLRPGRSTKIGRGFFYVPT